MTVASNFDFLAPHDGQLARLGALAERYFNDDAPAALIKLRKSEPDLLRTYRAPFYPVFPAIAFGLGLVCLGAMVWFNAMLTLFFVVLMALGYVYFLATAKQRLAAAPDAMLST